MRNGEQQLSSLADPEHGRARSSPNELDDDTEAFIYQSTRELIEELALFEGDPAKVESSASLDPTPEIRNETSVLCLSARDEADFLISLALCQVLERAGFSSRSPEPETLAEVLSPTAEAVPGVICISAMPPFALTHARMLLKKARNRFPDASILICYWLFDGDAGKVGQPTKVRCPMPIGDHPAAGNSVYSRLERCTVGRS
jgi:hypothetical protein